MVNKWKLWIGVLLLFLCSAVAGAFVNSLYAKNLVTKVLQRDPETLQRIVMKQLERRIDLSGPQSDALRIEVARMHEELTEILRRSRPEMRVIVTQGTERMKAHLSPAQQIELQKFFDDVKKRREQRLGLVTGIEMEAPD